MIVPVPKPETPRCPRLLEYVRTLPCLICAAAGDQQQTPTEAAHVHAKRNGGDWGNVCPLCHFHHIEQLHHWGQETFERAYNISLEAESWKVWGWFLLGGEPFLAEAPAGP